MPYIKQEDRDLVEQTNLPMNAGQLNYLITKMIHSYIERAGGNYQAHNDVIGALEACKMELYRRKTASYEDLKINENGDV